MATEQDYGNTRRLITQDRMWELYEYIMTKKENPVQSVHYDPLAEDLLWQLELYIKPGHTANICSDMVTFLVREGK